VIDEYVQRYPVVSNPLPGSLLCREQFTNNQFLWRIYGFQPVAGIPPLQRFSVARCTPRRKSCFQPVAGIPPLQRDFITVLRKDNLEFPTRCRDPSSAEKDGRAIVYAICLYEFPTRCRDASSAEPSTSNRRQYAVPVTVSNPLPGSLLCRGHCFTNLLSALWRFQPVAGIPPLQR